MEKKRRETKNFKVIDLVKEQLTLKNVISKEVKQNERCGLLKVKREVYPEFGKGEITEYYFDGVNITISNFIFNNNFIFFNELDVNALCLSFLVKGEMLIQINNSTDDIPCEENECLMTYIKKFKGALKFYNNKPFKEVKLTISNTFLKKHNFIEASEFKKLTDSNIIIPITHRVFSVIEAIEEQYGEGLVQRLFLEAKVLEIVALQLENYKAFNVNNNGLVKPKPLKRLFVLKQFLENNLNENFAIQELADVAGLSENILKLEFKRVFNCTVNQYFLELKMKKAMYVLQNTDAPIYEIAEIVGYKNATHFSAAFKRFYNKTPKSFRNKVV
ncbi:helix-turn-helix domain-containing protein [Algibacter sp. PT7-4]|uniref:helix-turn-helix domain-containing protein n=1 Tax=Algibacter ulvanivorans TaxID=3400999 RepID=UPI003AB0FE00